jgi:hypothetical protein
MTFARTHHQVLLQKIQHWVLILMKMVGIAMFTCWSIMALLQDRSPADEGWFR